MNDNEDEIASKLLQVGRKRTTDFFKLSNFRKVTLLEIISICLCVSVCVCVCVCVWERCLSVDCDRL